MPDPVTNGRPPAAFSAWNGRRPLVPDRPEVAGVRLSLRHRSALRNAVGYSVESPEGEIGLVTEIRMAPFEYWPEELIVTAPVGPRVRVPVATIAAMSSRKKRILVVRTPPGAGPILRPREPRLTRARASRILAAAGGVLGVGSTSATFVALALDAALTWAPGLAASGAASGAASAASWRNAGRSSLAAIGLGSFWLPLCAGLVLSLVLVFR